MRLNRCLAVAAGTVVLLAMGGAASADPIPKPEYGTVKGSCATFKKIIDVKWIPVYQGYMCGAMWKTERGSWKKSMEIYALAYKFEAISEICDWWVDFDFYDGDTRERYYHSQGTKQSGCTRGAEGTRTADMPMTVRYGQMCVRMYQNRQTDIKHIITTCTNIG